MTASPPITPAATLGSALTGPRHVAMIMDGNGRWAQARGLERVHGHRAGAKTVREITTACRERGVRYLTLYAFSSENWGRPQDEVGSLMALLADYLKEERHTLTDNQIELHTIGAIDKLPLAVRLVLGAVKEATKGLQGMRLTLALSYGARDELLRAIRGVVTELGPTRNAGAIDEAMLERHLDTAGMPDPDLLIRTSGEMRISNFMLWQLAYTELYVTDVAWPDFTPAHLQAAFDAFAQRQRRFGKTAAQLKTTTGGRST